jgi:hypothetical protein
MLDLSIGKCEYSTDTRTIEYHVHPGLSLSVQRICTYLQTLTFMKCVFV